MIQEAGCRLCRRIVLYSALVIVTIAAIVALVALELRQSALNTGRANAANLSAAFEEQVRRALDSLSGAMERTKQGIEAEGGAFDLAGWTRLASELAGQPIAVAVTGPDGIIRAGKPMEEHPHQYFWRGLFPGSAQQRQRRTFHRQARGGPEIEAGDDPTHPPP